MVRILTIFFFVYSICGFSQRTVGSKPDKYSKIIFEYEQKLNVYIDDSGIYADTLVFKELFKEYPIVLKRHPKDTRKMVGFLPKRNVQKDKIDKIIGIFSHNNFLIKGEYNVKNQRVVFSFSRSENDSVQKKLKTIFQRTYPNSSGRDKIIDYRKNIISRELTLLTFESPFDVSKNSNVKEVSLVKVFVSIFTTPFCTCMSLYEDLT